MYTMEELAALQPADTYEDDRYKLIRGNNSIFLSALYPFFSEAVPIKFKLDDEQVDQIFSEWLHEVFLAKRRVAVSKLKIIKN